MTDLIVFSISTNKYALKIENIQRIIQAKELTEIPNSNNIIDGMMSYEDGVIKVLNFRKLIGLPAYKEELNALFIKLKEAHASWVDSLKFSVTTGSKFTKTFNPHMCELGKWIDNFTAYDDRVASVLAELVRHHKQLHTRGEEICEIRKNDVAKAQEVVDIEINEIFNKTMGALDIFIEKLDVVSNSLQKLLIYENEGKIFAIKVDSIEDIAHIEESNLMKNDNENNNSEFLELDGVLDLDGVLINVIKTISLPN